MRETIEVASADEMLKLPPGEYEVVSYIQVIKTAGGKAEWTMGYPMTVRPVKAPRSRTS